MLGPVRLILVDDGAGRNSQMPKNVSDHFQPTLEVRQLDVDVAHTHATPTACHFSDPGFP
jgi:hypothetical protein